MCRRIFAHIPALCLVSAIALIASWETTSHAEDIRDFPLIGTPVLPVPEAEKTGATVVSKEEEEFLLMQAERQYLPLLHQSAFRGIEDHVISFPVTKSTWGEGCPLPRDYVDGLLYRNLLNLLPDVCYYLYTSYIHYPQNTGSPEVDRIIRSEYEDMDIGKATAEPELITYIIGRSSPRYISVASCLQPFWSGARDPQVWVVDTYDLQTGRKLELDDVFPDITRSEALLWKYPLWSLGGEPPLIRPESLDIKIDRLFPVQDGLYIIYNMCELGRACSDGLLVGYIPLADLANLGANTSLWEK